MKTRKVQIREKQNEYPLETRLSGKNVLLIQGPSIRLSTILLFAKLYTLATLRRLLIDSQGQTENQSITMRLLTNYYRHSMSPRSLRGGVTLTEVLISMGILAIGLLGAAAMFPVGGYYMQKGEIADRGAAIAQAAFADLVARGDLSPENWRAWDSSDSKYVSMGDATRSWMSANFGATDYPTKLNDAAGFVYIIDPLGTAGGVSGGTNPGQLGFAPARIPNNSMTDAVAADMSGRWEDFEGKWPVRRLCTSSTVIGNVPVESLAKGLYTSDDDLTFSLADDDSAPTQQRVLGIDSNSDGVPETAFARQSQGDYSWLAMVAPTTSAAREALMLDPAAYYFDVSVVVFFKRPIRTITSTESLVKGAIISTGTGGGEILLDSDGLADAYEDLRQGQWIMVSGPHPSSTSQEPLFFTQWYRVLVIDDEPDNLQIPGTSIAFNNADTQRRVGLRGPDWPWTKAGTPVRVGLFPGAVAVHTKTMRLESFGAFQ